MGATEGNKEIRTANLDYYLDARNYRSYPESGTSCTDLTTNAEVGTLVGGTGWTSPAFTFDNVNDHITVDGLVSTVNSNTTGTIEAWVNLNNVTTSGSKAIFDFGSTASAEFLIMEVESTTGRFYWYLKRNSVIEWYIYTDVTPFTAGVWCHVAGIHTGTTPQLYINGQSVATTFLVSNTPAFYLNNLTLIDNCRVGCRNEGGGGNVAFFDGDIAKIRQYNTNIGQSTLADHYESEKDIYGL